MGCGKGAAVFKGRTSMSSFHGMSASGCERAPLTVTACLLAGGAESSGFARLRSSILTASSDGIGTVLVASLIEQTTALSEGHGWRARDSDHERNGKKRIECSGRAQARRGELRWSCEAM
jgi:hypothetical protein